MSNALLDDLEWRGLIAQSTDRKELESALAKPISLYLGVDPTAASLHVGNLVVVLVLRRFQLSGHRPIALVGGATGLVGDPSGKNDERTLNEEKLVKSSTLEEAFTPQHTIPTTLAKNYGLSSCSMAKNLS